MSQTITVRALRYVDLLVPMQEGDTRDFEPELANLFVVLGFCEIVTDDKPKRTRKPQGGS